MVDLTLIIRDMLILAIITAASSIVLLPLVFIMAFVHRKLKEKHENWPGILTMYIATFIGALIFSLILYFYILASTGVRPVG